MVPFSKGASCTTGNTLDSQSIFCIETDLPASRTIIGQFGERFEENEKGKWKDTSSYSQVGDSGRAGPGRVPLHPSPQKQAELAPGAVPTIQQESEVRSRATGSPVQPKAIPALAGGALGQGNLAAWSQSGNSRPEP
ncbi:MAG: hypothetical protein A3J28_13435 [Acidobacteria bacterium RIFCSPLOWO2_12_FULL_60_22]|nr:MAG: hypothetical protein A3J28_13435 [Acidobacteria bacterium RIFCSPLOWO2_12_FULL_60_22]